MNKEKAMEELVKYLEEYEGQGFKYHINFIKELGELIIKHSKGNEKEVFNILVKQLGFVKTLGTDVYKANGNEILKELKTDLNVYSLHIANKIVNLRILMTFSPDNIPVFLVAFFEKSGKKVSSYSKWTPVVEERYSQIMGV